jgi:hypothetical protein
VGIGGADSGIDIVMQSPDGSKPVALMSHELIEISPNVLDPVSRTVPAEKRQATKIRVSSALSTSKTAEKTFSAITLWLIEIPSCH